MSKKKTYKASWVEKDANPFEGRHGPSVQTQTVTVDADMPMEQLESFAKENSPKGYVFRDVVEVNKIKTSNKETKENDK